MESNIKAKPSDNITINAKERQRQNRLNSVKHELESGNAKSFDQIFAIVSETRFSIELGVAFQTFRRKVEDPGEFTLNEIMRFAMLIGVKYDVMADWLRDRIKEKTKSMIFKD